MPAEKNDCFVSDFVPMMMVTTPEVPTTTTDNETAYDMLFSLFGVKVSKFYC